MPRFRSQLLASFLCWAICVLLVVPAEAKPYRRTTPAHHRDAARLKRKAKKRKVKKRTRRSRRRRARRRSRRRSKAGKVMRRSTDRLLRVPTNSRVPVVSRIRVPGRTGRKIGGSPGLRLRTRVIRSRVYRLRGCFEKGYARKVKKYPARIAFVVGRSGRVSRVRVYTVMRGPIVACIRHQVSKWRFSKVPDKVHHSFTLRPTDLNARARKKKHRGKNPKRKRKDYNRLRRILSGHL